MSRQAVHASYDAQVGLEPGKPGEIPSFAYALVKLTYELAGGRALPITAEPLQRDLYAQPPSDAPLAPGSDYWLHKAATDVIIRGSAYAPEGKQVSELQVVARVGALTKRVAVFGQRDIRWRKSGRIEVGASQPFTEMPLVYSNAYGGLDPRAPVPESQREVYALSAELGLAADHPGLYPRNPMGKGYCVYDEPILGLEMPNLEDPDDLLSPSRLVTGDPRLWYRQPLPWCFEWTNALMYPRALGMGLDAWYPCPEPHLLPEVRRGFLPLAAAQPEETREVAPAEVYQEASLGMVARSPVAGQPVVLCGMDPEFAELRFVVPAAPHIELEIDGQRSTPRPTLSNLVIRPHERKLTLVWCVLESQMPRKFVPGVHREIPLAVRVNSGPAVRYEAPPTLRDRLAAAAGAAAPIQRPPERTRG